MPMAPQRWRLRRNCSLTPRQALAAWLPPLAALAGVAVFSALQGWWWVVLFAVFNVAGLTAALYLYARHALDGDTLLLDEDGLLHIEQQHGGRQYCRVWPASMVRLDTGLDGCIQLRAGREQVHVGREVPDAVRRLAAGELRQALPLGNWPRSQAGRTPLAR